MFRKTSNAALLTLVCASLFTATGCTHWGPKVFTIGGWGSMPIPVSPYFQNALEDQAWMQERYETVPILGPITEGGPAVALDPPSQDEIIRALEKARPVAGGIPLLWGAQRNNVRMVVEPIADYIDPPRVYPMVGPAQLHHAHYKCTIYFQEVIHTGWPIPYTTTNDDAEEVVYIDHEHLHIVGNIDAGVGSEY